MTYKNHSTWHGDIPRLLMSVEIGNTVKDDALIDRVQDTGNYVLNGLRDLEQRYDVTSNSRGRGSIMAFDTKVPQGEFVAALLQHGVNVSGCGYYSIRLRPSLTLTRDEANIFLEIMEKTIKRFGAKV